MEGLLLGNNIICKERFPPFCVYLSLSGQHKILMGVPEEDWEGTCHLKCVWRKMLWEFSHPGQESCLLRAFWRRGQQQTAVQYAERCSLPFPEPAAAAAAAAAEGVNLFW